GVVNLLAAGRIVSVSDALWDNTRSIPCCSVTGTAAGTAAALFDDFDLSPDGIAALRAAIRAGGMKTSLSELDL
ncbi:MAG: FAD-dependent oxidoreductase, partial [Clostridia bacterium]|nr:FAD-dependent oxidoreductase [Clostridia bacterium]